jgi:hypothetical protein
MARAFYLGHGATVPGVGKTFVPAGKSISFYCNVDDNTLRANGLAALNAGDLPLVETSDAESEVDNYIVSRPSRPRRRPERGHWDNLLGDEGNVEGPHPSVVVVPGDDCARVVGNPRH